MTSTVDITSFAQGSVSSDATVLSFVAFFPLPSLLLLLLIVAFLLLAPLILDNFCFCMNLFLRRWGFFF